MRKHFDSDEILKQFGNDHFETPGLWCGHNHYCLDCEFFFCCNLGRTQRDDSDMVSEQEPCGCDVALRNIGHGIELRRYDFKSPHTDKAWHDKQELIFQKVSVGVKNTNE